MRVSVVQNSAADDVRANIDFAAARCREAAAAGAELIALPENFSLLHQSDDRYLSDGYEESTHPALTAFAELAAELGVWILLGSLTVKCDGDRVNNRSLLLDADGHVVARYNKVHLFDVSLKNGERYEESRTVAPGTELVVADTPWGRLGLTVCYDLRFPYLYRRLAKLGADIIAAPAAFTQTTGEAHWHTLVRARAIETGCFLVAPDQCGVRPWGRATYGHSLIVDPWGRVLADAGVKAGIASADLDLSEVARVRRMIPALEHDRPLD